MADLTLDAFDQALAARQPTGVEPVAPVRQRGPARDRLSSLQRILPTGEAIPFDTTTGAPFLTRLRASTAPDETTRQALLQQSFSGARVEALPEDMPEGFIIRDFRDPETGQVKDLLVDEKGLNLKDLADLGQLGVELVGAYAMMRGGRGATQQLPAGVRRLVGESVLAATGSQAAGALTDIAARSTAGQPIQPLEIIERRRGLGAQEAALGGALSLLPAAGAAFLNLRRGVPQTPDAARAIQARNRLAEGTGVTVPFTRGQQTGSERIRQSEEFLENVSFGGGPQRAARLQQEAAIGEQQTRLIEQEGGLPAYALPNKDQLGSRAVAALRSIATQAEGATTQARAQAFTTALGDLRTAMENSTGMASRTILEDEAGSAIKTFVQLKKDALNEIEGQLGDEVDRLVGNQPFIATPKAKQSAIKVLQDAYAKPGTAGELMASTPATLRPILQDIQALPPQATLSDLRRVRHSINRQISQGEILGDTDTGVLKQLSSILTDAVSRGTGANLTPDAAAALKRYNQFYSEGIEGFQVKGITEILADPTQRKLGPFAIFDQAAKDPDQYFRLKDATTKPLMLEGQPVGPTAAGQETWNTFKQAMFQRLYDESRKSANRSLLDPKALLNKLTNLPVRVMEDLLGPQRDIALRALRRLEVLDNPKVAADEALDILRQGGDTASDDLLNLAKREAELKKLYTNQAIRPFLQGRTGASTIKEGDFIERFADDAPIAHVKEAMDKLESVEPGITLTIRQKKIQDLFAKAQQNPLNDEVAAKKLAKEIRTPEQQARLGALLGEPALSRLNDYMDMLAHIQRAGDKAARQGGSLVSGGVKAQALTLTGIIAAVPKQLQYYFTGTLIANPRLWRMATHPIQPLDPSKAARALILSDDFVLETAKEFGREAPAILDTFMGAAPERGANGDVTPEAFDRALQERSQRAR